MLLAERADTAAAPVLPGATGYATPVVDEKTGKEVYDPMNRYKASPPRPRFPLACISAVA